MSMPNGIKLLYDFASLDNKISPNGQAHFWGEPLWGYYNSDDEWVMHRQILMLTQAGVDFIVFDATNAVTYRSAYTKLLAIIDNYIRQGWNPPELPSIRTPGLLKQPSNFTTNFTSLSSTPPHGTAWMESLLSLRILISKMI